MPIYVQIETFCKNACDLVTAYLGASAANLVECRLYIGHAVAEPSKSWMKGHLNELKRAKKGMLAALLPRLRELADVLSVRLRQNASSRNELLEAATIALRPRRRPRCGSEEPQVCKRAG
jgi:hypothetical protein